MVWAKVSELLGLAPSAQSDREHELALATAALLVQVSVSDANYDAREKLTLLSDLQKRFGLTEEEAVHILNEAELAQTEANCLYRFTRVVASELNQEGRQDIVRLLWRVAFADHTIDNLEANAIAKIAGLLGVSTEDRIRIKHEVEAEE